MPESKTQPSASSTFPRARVPRRRRWIALVVTLVLLLPAGISWGTVLFNDQFTEKKISSCTVGKSGPQSTRRSVLRAKVASDCGRFRAGKEVACISDPSRAIVLSPGATYDLVVRGPRIPLLSAPTVISASMSAKQLVADSEIVTEVDPSAHENVQELQRAQLPETLRAFDYEQPPFDPSCDAFRHVMTTAGIQQVSAIRAEQLLTVPAGLEPREPKLPCQGFQCS